MRALNFADRVDDYWIWYILLTFPCMVGTFSTSFFHFFPEFRGFRNYLFSSLNYFSENIGFNKIFQDCFFFCIGISTFGGRITFTFSSFPYIYFGGNSRSLNSSLIHVHIGGVIASTSDEL